jgi:hypothetical protein
MLRSSKIIHVFGYVPVLSAAGAKLQEDTSVLQPTGSGGGNHVR